MTPEITNRIKSAWGAIHSLDSYWASHAIPKKVKAILFEALVVPRLVYACATWIPDKRSHKYLCTRYVKMVCYALKILPVEHTTIRNSIKFKSHTRILSEAGLYNLQVKLDSRVLQFSGHVKININYYEIKHFSEVIAQSMKTTSENRSMKLN